MPDLGNTSVFSQTDASNNSGTQPSWSGAAAPSTLDDAGRGLQGAVTREWNWRSYTLTAGGTADAKTLTYSVAPAAYYNGQRFAFIANTTNTTTATLNVNGLGAKTIKKVVSGVLTNLSASDMVSGAFVEVAYNLANDCFVWSRDELPQALGTGDSPQFAGVNVGNASDTTITRSAAGVIAVEGGVIPKENRANTFTASQGISTGALNASLFMDANSGTIRGLFIRTGTTNRFVIGANTNAESGSDNGSNLDVYRYSDAGALLGTPISVNRATGLTTLESLTVPTINVGNTDTTITRSAAGVIAVEGNPVISAAGTAAQGDVLYYNGTAWVRLAAGTSGQFLKTNGAGANPSWASESSTVLLGTLTTTSGASQTLSSLVLTNYKFLRLVFNGVSGSSTGTFSFGTFQVTGTNTAGDAWIGIVDVDLATGIGASNIAATAGSSVTRVGSTGYTTASTSVTLSVGLGNFDAGSVAVYGVA